VVVTGAGGGVGRGIACACAAAGADVVVMAPNENGGDVAAEIQGRGGSALWSRGDVTTAVEVAAAVDLAIDATGRLDAMIHNATSRRSSEPARLEELGDETLDDHVAVSLRGAYLCARAAALRLREMRGRFVVMTSPAGMEGSLMLPAYGMVKAALRGFAKSLAREWAPDGVTVNVLSPLAETPAMTTAVALDPELATRLARRVPLGRLGDPETDIGAAVVFLVGDGGAFITGQTLPVDGGRYMAL
jgi:NAD(P)-dependent dehydrogenase (short-subunit alcohol dehydrogenase family)